MLLSGRPVYNPNPLRPNPNLKKSVSGSCRVRGLGRTLTPLIISLFFFLEKIISHKAVQAEKNSEKENNKRRDGKNNNNDNNNKNYRLTKSDK